MDGVSFDTSQMSVSIGTLRKALDTQASIVLGLINGSSQTSDQIRSASMHTAGIGQNVDIAV